MSMFGGCQARAARLRRGGPTFPLPSRFGPTRFAVSIYRFHLNAREVLIRKRRRRKRTRTSSRARLPMAGCSQPILIGDTKQASPEAADDASLLIQAEARKDAGVAAFDEDAQFAAICDFCSRVLEDVGVALREDAVTPGDAVLARKLLGEMVDAYSLREDANTLRVNAAAFASLCFDHAKIIHVSTTWPLPDNLHMVPLKEALAVFDRLLADQSLSSLSNYTKADGATALTGDGSTVLANLCRVADYSSSAKLQSIAMEDLSPAQPEGPVQRSENGTFISASAKDLVLSQRFLNVLLNRDYRVHIIQCSNLVDFQAAIASQGGQCVPVPKEILEELGVRVNQTNFCSAGARDRKFGVFCAEVNGVTKLLLVCRSVGHSLSIYAGKSQEDNLACLMGLVKVARRISGAPSLLQMTIYCAS